MQAAQDEGGIMQPGRRSLWVCALWRNLMAPPYAGVFGEDRRSAIGTCILLSSHDSSPPASSLNMNYSLLSVTRRESEPTGGEVVAQGRISGI